MYERCASFNRYGDLSKFITDPDLLQATGDGGVYISNEDNYDIAVYLETCYASFDEVKPFINVFGNSNLRNGQCCTAVSPEKKSKKFTA